MYAHQNNVKNNTPNPNPPTMTRNTSQPWREGSGPVESSQNNTSSSSFATFVFLTVGPEQ